MNAPDSEADTGLKVLQADADAAGQRLDQWLAAALGADFSRNRVQTLIRQGAVSIGGVVSDQPKRKMADGDIARIDLPEPEPAEPQGENIPLDVLYEDDSLIVINKPAGLVVHPGAGNWTGTLVNALIHHCGDSLSGIGGVRRPGIVHRLDKETTGVMVVAKSDIAHRALSEAFADHGASGELERAYQALVWGIPPRMTGKVDAHLGRAADRVRRAVVPEGRDDARHAVTHFTVLEKFGEQDLKGVHAASVECRLETGRTHQIRVHMAHIGHPVIGDPDYGQALRTKANRLPEPVQTLVKSFPRQALHAGLLAFLHPVTQIKMSFEAPLPADMQAILDGLRNL
ncbi:RluA family pseudouridine synthase [Mesorhizobium sp. NBSH29]|uniref:RluA family pseudouridine synthase n=1 Tax=Mesorhizobium sp. NBSH29 TaxID=2654249 RepID=UPI00189660CC|nr:RluA family pseudouridine synthase [Mesorhizobium sp. NBSH29]QPC85751.1 RluA family pseudouridine synthase [Mesorhizobium sp. NBSH29]